MKVLSKEEIYKRNQKAVKVYKWLAPVTFWGLLAISIILFILAIRNSIGNIAEIIDMLQTDTHTGEELSANYNFLVAKYGEWVIGTGSNGFQMVFINIKKAVFSGIAISCIISCVISLIGAFVLGKWLFPALSDKTLQENQDMVNLTILKKE